jgi:hypothetical protein
MAARVSTPRQSTNDYAIPRCYPQASIMFRLLRCCGLRSTRPVNFAFGVKPGTSTAFSGSRPLYAGRRLPSHQAPDRLVPVELPASGFDDACFLTTRHRRVCFRSSLGHTPARGHAPSFCSNAHHHGFWPPLSVVPHHSCRGCCAGEEFGPVTEPTRAPAARCVLPTRSIHRREQAPMAE